MPEPVRQLCVIGVGLIGGSFARALRAKHLVQEVVGVGRSRANLEEAVRLGVIDRFCLEPAAAVKDADLVFLATPVRAMPGIVRAIRAHLAPAAIITDAASTKARLVRAVERLLRPAGKPSRGRSLLRFVPGHPIAGKEKTGVAASAADLFVHHWTILTPTPQTEPQAVSRVKELWEACGARVELMSAGRHDRILGAISHLPHLVAYALMETLIQWDAQVPMLRYSAGGLKDFTRIAASSPEMWRDICLENQAAILQALDRYGQALKRLRRLVAAADGEALEQMFTACRTVRTRQEE